MKIGIVGYSSGKFDLEKAYELLDIGIESVEIMAGSTASEIVSGLTNVGIPGLAYKWATTLKVPTIGIACSKASEYECFPVDKKIIHGDNWGDESQIFLDYIDALVRIGGGEQSLKEVAAFKSKNPLAPIVELNLPREE